MEKVQQLLFIYHGYFVRNIYNAWLPVLLMLSLTPVVATMCLVMVNSLTTPEFETTPIVWLPYDLYKRRRNAIGSVHWQRPRSSWIGYWLGIQ